MENIKEYYSSKVDNLLYLELKIKKYNIDFPLPIIKDDFIEEIRNGTFNEEIEFKYFIRGIIYNLSIDSNFKYSKEYNNLLNQNIERLDKFVVKIALEELEKDISIANIFLKFNYDRYNNVKSNYLFATTLLGIFEEMNLDFFLEEAEKVLNENIVLQEEYPLNYILLGDIEIYRNNLIKGNYYYLEGRKRAIDNLQEEIVDEVDSKLNLIRDEVLLLENKNLLENSKYYEIIDILEQVSIDDYRKYYYLANAYFGIMDYEKAFKNYEIAEEYGNKDVEFFIDYSYFLSQVGYIELALKIIQNGLKSYFDNEKLLFNRAVIYLNIGEIEKAKEDLTNIIQYYDISEDIFNNSMLLLEKIQDL